MNVGQVAVREAGDRVERSAVLSWDGGEFELRCSAPAAVAAGSPDASGFLCAALPLAMRFGEDLNVEGPVSPRLLGRLEQVQAIYAAWEPSARRVRVTAAPAAPAAGSGRAAGTFFSRGVDSMYSASRADAGTQLVFVDGLEPLHDDHVRLEERRAAATAAAALGLPLLTCETNLRELTRPHVADWEDFVGPGLAFIAHQLSRGLERLLIPSTDQYATVEPCGTSPLLDPLFSSEGVSVEHDELTFSRLGKVRRLVVERPDVLPHLKVCWAENRPDNCGRCPKCLLTMACLQTAGALRSASLFPEEIDLDAVRAIRFRRPKARVDWLEVALAEGQDPELRDVVLTTMGERGLMLDGEPRVEPRSMRDHRLNVLLELAVGGAPPRGPRGLVRAVSAGRHVYGVGFLPEGEVSAELGALRDAPADGTRPLWLTAEGRLAAREPQSVPPPPTVAGAARWVLAPLTWRDVRSTPSARLRALAWRARCLLPRAVVPAVSHGRPVGHLHAEPGPGRVALYSAHHPFTGDQMLTNAAHEAGDLGYGGVALLGHLEAVAPVTGRLGAHRTPHLVWASRFGQRFRTS